MANFNISTVSGGSNSFADTVNNNTDSRSNYNNNNDSRRDFHNSDTVSHVGSYSKGDTVTVGGSYNTSARRYKAGGDTQNHNTGNGSFYQANGLQNVHAPPADQHAGQELTQDQRMQLFLKYCTSVPTFPPPPPYSPSPWKNEGVPFKSNNPFRNPAAFPRVNAAQPQPSQQATHWAPDQSQEWYDKA